MFNLVYLDKKSTISTFWCNTLCVQFRAKPRPAQGQCGPWTNDVTAYQWKPHGDDSSTQFDFSAGTNEDFIQFVCVVWTIRGNLFLLEPIRCRPIILVYNIHRYSTGQHGTGPMSACGKSGLRSFNFLPQKKRKIIRLKRPKAPLEDYSFVATGNRRP